MSLTDRQGICPACGHEWNRHDPEDGTCDAHRTDGIGVCPCGRTPGLVVRLDTDMPRRIANLESENERLREGMRRLQTLVNDGYTDELLQACGVTEWCGTQDEFALAIIEAATKVS